MRQPTNEVIVQRIDDMDKNLTDRLKKINGAVEANTRFRLISYGALKVIGILLGGGGLISGVVALIKYSGWNATNAIAFI